MIKGMYKLKSKCSDFIVEEVMRSKGGGGPHVYFTLKKEDFTTIRALKVLGKAWEAPLGNFGYAGLKDKTSISTQLCSVKGVPKEIIEGTKIEGLEIEVIGRGRDAIKLADLVGNKFEITLRDITGDYSFREYFVNTYGEQRFSTHNVATGKALLQKKYGEAVELLKEQNAENIEEMEEHLSEFPTDYIGAIKLLPKTIMMLYVHAYQSYMWNKVAMEYVKGREVDFLKTIPLFGFGTEFDDEEIEEMYDKILGEEGLSERDFINKSIPALSVYGADRRVWVQVKELEHSKKDNIVKVKFMLQKGSYATEYIRQSFESLEK